LRLIRGARLMTDHENRLGGSRAHRGPQERLNKRVKEKLASLSTEYGLSSSQMALVAVIERENDQAGKLPKTTIVPVGMPQDVAFDSYFMPMASQFSLLSAPKYMAPQDSKVRYSIEPCCEIMPPARHYETPQEYTEDDLMVDLAAMIESDGGMPGDSIEDRILISLIVLLYFYQNGNTLEVGAFRVHVKKLIGFLTSSMDGCPQQYQSALHDFMSKIENDHPPQKNLLRYVLDIKSLDFVPTDEIWSTVFSIYE
ncbi:MAG TPA: hypothetical protein VIL29_08975, partial [Pseudothermotoga sp.]